MKTGFKHWPLVLALVLGAVVFFASRAKPQPAVFKAGQFSEDADLRPVPATVPGGQEPAADPGPAGALKVEHVPAGSLLVTLTGTEEAFWGHLVVIDSDNVSESDQDVSGRTKAELPVSALKPGAKTVVFIPDRYYSVAFAEAVIVPAQETRVSLRLKDAAAIRGVVVDSLQKPLPGARVEMMIAGVLPPRAGKQGPNPLWSESLGRWSGRSGMRGVIYLTRELGWDGTLKKSITTDHQGTFTLDGVAGPAVKVELTYKDVHFSQVCPTDADTLLIVPVIWEPPPRNLEAEELDRATTALLRQMALYPQASDAYAAQLRDLLTRNLEKSNASPQEREEIRKRIEAIGRPTPPR